MTFLILYIILEESLNIIDATVVYKYITLIYLSVSIVDNNTTIKKWL